jgi:hypothetical protein
MLTVGDRFPLRDNADISSADQESLRLVDLAPQWRTLLRGRRD